MNRRPFEYRRRYFDRADLDARNLALSEKDIGHEPTWPRLAFYAAVAALVALVALLWLVPGGSP